MTWKLSTDRVSDRQAQMVKEETSMPSSGTSHAKVTKRERVLNRKVAGVTEDDERKP